MKAAKNAAFAPAFTFVMVMGACGTRGQAPAVSPLGPAPSPPKIGPTTPAQLHEQMAAEVLAGLRDHDFDAVERHFDAPMQRAVPKEKVIRVWSRAVAAKGEMTSWALVERDTPEGYDRLRFRLDHEQGTWEAVITFPLVGSDVVGLLIRPPQAP